MTTPTLETESLILKPLHHATNQAVEWLLDPKNMRFSEQRHRKHTLATEQAYVRSFDHVNNHIWVIRLNKPKPSDVAIGNITAHRDRINGVAEMGILIDHHWSGRGYGRQAWSAVMDYLLQDMRKVEAGTRDDNLPMRSIMQRCGMGYEGDRWHHFLDGENTHHLIMYGKMKGGS